MVTKDELFDFLKNKKEIPENKIEQVWLEKQEEVKKSGLTTPQEIEIMTLKKVSLYFRKVVSGGGSEVPFSFLVLGISGENDFGASKKYHDALKMAKKDLRIAIMQGFVNEQGIPLWKDASLASKNGKPIVPVKELRRTVFGLAYDESEENPIQKPAIITLSESALKHVPIPGYSYSIKAGISKATAEKWKKERYVLYSTSATEFIDGKKVEVEKIRELINTILPEEMKVSWEGIRKRAENPPFGDWFVVKALVVSSKDTNAGTNNNMTIADPDDVLFDEDLQLTGWMDENIPLNVADESMDVYIVCSARLYNKTNEAGTSEEALQFEIYGFYPQEQDIKDEVNTPIVGNVGSSIDPGVEEEVVGDATPDSEEEKVEEKQQPLPTTEPEVKKSYDGVKMEEQPKEEPKQEEPKKVSAW